MSLLWKKKFIHYEDAGSVAPPEDGAQQITQQTRALAIADAATMPGLAFGNGQEWELGNASLLCTGSGTKTLSFIVNDDLGDLQPIGGGPGYMDIVDPADADHTVTNLAELITAVSTATSGEIIYVDLEGEIDCTGNQFLLSAGVILAGARGDGTKQGALLYTNTMYAESAGGITPNDALIEASGLGCRITGLRLRGPDLESIPNTLSITGFADGGGGQVIVTSANHTLRNGHVVQIFSTTNYNGFFTLTNVTRDTFEVTATWVSDDGTGNLEVGANSAIRSLVGGTEIDNCEIYGFSKWNIHLFSPENDDVHHNHIHHCQRLGFGYNLWASGAVAAPAFEDIALMRYNIIEFARHQIGTGGQDESSIKFYGNIVRHHRTNHHPLDRHGDGATTIMTNNIVGSVFNECFNIDDDPIEPSEFLNNFMDYNIQHYARASNDGTVFTVYEFKNLNSEYNSFNAIWREKQPSITSLSANIVGGPSPLTVVFTATGHDPDGVPLNGFVWEFQSNRERNWTAGGSFTKTFTTGVHVVSVSVRNAAGLISEFHSITVEARPNANAGTLLELLSAWWPLSEAGDTNRVDSQHGLEFQEIGSAVGQVAGLDGRNCADFNGTPSLFLPSNQTETLQLFQNDCAISLWVNSNNLDVVDFAAIISLGGSSGVDIGYILTTRVTGALFLRVTDGVTTSQGSSPVASFTLNTWHHIAINFDYDGNVEVHIDGSASPSISIAFPFSVASPSGFMPSLFSPGNLFLAGIFAANKFDGQMQDLAFWRRKLTTGEIASLYNSGIPISHPDLPL